MRIALVSAHYMPEIGYLEVHLARAFSRAGNRVCVFTTNQVPAHLRKIVPQNYPVGEAMDELQHFPVFRLKVRFAYRQVAVSSGLRKSVLNFEPDLIVVTGLSKMFAYPIFSRRTFLHVKVVTVLNANVYNQRLISERPTNIWRHGLYKFKTYVVQKLMKNRIYRIAVNRSDQLIMCNPQTEQVIAKYLGKKDQKLMREKSKPSSLGFDANVFYFDLKERKTSRALWGVNKKECILISATRVEPSKRIETVIKAVERINDGGIPLHYVLVGCQEDEYGKLLKKRINESPYSRQFHVYGFLPHTDLRKFYAGADVAIWTLPAISILEAMGTGIPIMLEENFVFDHLLKETFNGWHYKKGQLNVALQRVAEDFINEAFDDRLARRKQILNYNVNKFSYDSLIKDYLD